MKPFLYMSAYLAAAAAGGAAHDAPGVAVQRGKCGSVPIRKVTEKLVFEISLAEFTIMRDREVPVYMDWTSDGCTNAMDNPFEFPFLPACHRHDFGYNNYRRHDWFTKRNKDQIDDKFLEDLYSQCDEAVYLGACQVLAKIYYLGVRIFGPGATAEKRTDKSVLLKQLDELKAVYEEEVRRAQAKGDLPILRANDGHHV